MQSVATAQVESESIADFARVLRDGPGFATRPPERATQTRRRIDLDP